MGITTVPSPIQAAVRKFPLVGRPRPACPSLTDRITELADISAARTSMTMQEAAHVLNMAALTASDCGLPNLARQWCWQHINVYRRRRTLTAVQAGYLLEPVLNLARLQIRAHDSQPALHLLQSMYRAITASTDLIIEGRALPLAGMTGTREELGQLRQWVWLQYLSEGIRILALAGRWDDAVQHVATLNGIGLHLMEGRQATIISHLLHQDTDAARTALDDTTATEPWEQQVSSCLAAMCPRPGMTDQTISAMIGRFFAYEPRPGYALYRARWGLITATLASGQQYDTAKHLLDHVAAEILHTPDGYAARELLGRTTEQLPHPTRDALTRIVTTAGLAARAIPEPLLQTLMEATHSAEHALAASIG